FSEEFGVNAKPLCLITENSFLHNGKNVLLKAYLVEVDSDGIKNPYVLTEHSEYKWVSIDEIPVENFVDSDLKIYPEVKNFVKNQLKAEQ
ncbi:MAG: CTP pyrophosphohydrolase, partial [Spirochaetales bacterium]|nr:CTP pyrophosphohydrolase [Spirochaetales bacterium]